MNKQNNETSFYKQSMKIKMAFYLLLATVLLNKTFAQKMIRESNHGYYNSYFGFGIGQDYGAIGIRAEYLPSKYIGIFAGAGYALIDPAFNVGISAKLIPDRKFCPTITAMYGYNAVLSFKDFYNSITANSKIYYGFTMGVGGELKIDKYHGHKLSIGVLVPFRNSTFQKDYNEVKDAGYTFKPDIVPVTFSIGVNFSISKKANKK